MTDEALSSLLAGDSREVMLTCDPAGVITWADERAQRHLGVRAGMAVTELVVPGVQEKVKTLLARAQGEPVRESELPLLVGGQVASYRFTARPFSRGVALVGTPLPAGYARALEQVQETMGEVVELNRRIAGQNRALEQAYRELDESNRGVLSLHAELADKAETLQRTADVKARVVANVSHEFRTPLHTILGLSQLLLDGTDGPLTAEQQKQLRFVRTAAEELAAMVDDLLDLSKVESGRLQLRPERFTVADLFAALRGALRPLLPQNAAVQLRFEAPSEPLMLETDQAKLGQILRNLISNALKFTEAGEVRVGVRRHEDEVLFSVSDTGIGIAREDFDLVFEEFGQVDGPAQRRVRGTGLGLPLARRLAELLGGTVTVESEVGVGSTFTVALPAVHPDVRQPLQPVHQGQLVREKSLARTGAPSSVLVVDDDERARYLLRKLVEEEPVVVLEAANGAEGVRMAHEHRPHIIFLDFVLGDGTAFDVIDALKADPSTRSIPIVIVTSHRLEQEQRARLQAGAEAIIAKESLSRELAINRIRDALRRVPTNEDGAHQRSEGGKNSATSSS